MADVYDGWGERPGSPRSPTRPSVMRRRQSMQIIDLESQLDEALSQNRKLIAAREVAEQKLRLAESEVKNRQSDDGNDEGRKDKDLREKQLKEVLTQSEFILSKYELSQGKLAEQQQQIESYTQELNTLRTAKKDSSTRMTDLLKRNERLANDATAMRAQITNLRQELHLTHQQLHATREATRQAEHLPTSSQNNDLLDLFKLEAIVTDEHTTHEEIVSDRTRNIRHAKVSKQWNKERNIGGGTFGEVWLETREEAGVPETRAVKIINKNRMRRMRIDYNKELLALAMFSKLQYQQEVIVKFLGWFEDPSNIFLCMEYFELGDLELHLTGPMKEDEVKDIAMDVLDGLRIMHNKHFAHRDLKPGNIFVVQKPPTSRWWVKIGDFGISKRSQRDVTELRTHIGTPLYMAPEITGDFEADEPTAVYDNAVDLWSLGCVIHRLVTQRVPFERPRDLRKFCDGRESFPTKYLAENMSMDGVEFVKRLIVPNPRQRLSAEEALKEGWLSRVTG